MDKPSKPLVVVGLVGRKLDSAPPESRWERWRPTVDLFRHDDLLVARLELLHTTTETPLARQVAEDVRSVSPETEVRLHELPIASPWDFEQVFESLYEFANAYTFDTDTHDYLVHITTGSHVEQICLFLLTESRHLPAKLVQTGPPNGRRGEPGTRQVIDLDLSRYDRIARRHAREAEDALTFLKSGIETRNEAFNALMARIEQVALASRAPILLTGSTGTGKSALARRLYSLKSARRLVRGAFVELNCATLRGDAAMSALFGHRRGAFTGAAQDRAGLLKAADGGMLFLDEIGELGADEQAMLLRAIEEKRFLPLGSDREESSDFQLVAGTNRDLPAAVREGRFRADLLARLDLWTFRLPDLVERREDLEPNVRWELERHAREQGRRVSFNREGSERFLRFALSNEARWSANFRDLGAAITRMATLAPGGRIGEREVAEEIARLRAAWGDAAALPAGRVQTVLGERAGTLDRFDRVQLEDVLAVCATSASLSDAGRALFSESRRRRASTNDADRLRKYLARFDLTWEDARRA